jgi:formylglycine-generating enzyme required for sulfatase activity
LDTIASSYLKNKIKMRPPNKRSEPLYWHDKKWNNPLAPVVGISWFEAEAYANWLSRQLERPIRLPSEQEWERAARGTEGRIYAWGDGFHPEKLNYYDFWLGDFDLSTTTIVGQFPDGNTPEGISDLSGNVWELTSSWFDNLRVSRVARGGSWGDVRSANCASRQFVSLTSSPSIGFRLISPATTQE